MVGKTKLINEELLKRASDGLNKVGRYSKIAVKLRAIIAAGEYGIAPVARMYKIARSTLIKWIKRLQEDISRLEVAKGRGKKSTLNQQQQEQIAKWLAMEHNLTINALRLRIIQEFNISLSKSTVHRVMQSKSYSYITPRPRHYKQDPSKHDEFKKNAKGKS